MTKEQLYKKFAKYYDKIYSEKDYEEEVEFIEWAIKKHKKSRGNKLLDVACGTGAHAMFLKKSYDVLGIDISQEMLKIARKKVKGVKFSKGDMKKLDLKERFDIIICLFSSINYNTDYKELKNTLGNFRKHLKKGGIVIFDLGFFKENWMEGRVWVDTFVDKDLQLARITHSYDSGGVFNAKFVFLVKDKGKLDFEIDEHKLGIFEVVRVEETMNSVGFTTFLYGGLTKKKWTKKSKKRVVVVGVR
jgi:ubiquinone/menaquinone biosynthesis C-methylase UbiE